MEDGRWMVGGGSGAKLPIVRTAYRKGLMKKGILATAFCKTNCKKTRGAYQKTSGAYQNDRQFSTRCRVGGWVLFALGFEVAATRPAEKYNFVLLGFEGLKSTKSTKKYLYKKFPSAIMALF
jgi:hypothetical protein